MNELNSRCHVWVGILLKDIFRDNLSFIHINNSASVVSRIGYDVVFNLSASRWARCTLSQTAIMLGNQKRHEVFFLGLLELNRAEEERSS